MNRRNFVKTGFGSIAGTMVMSQSFGADPGAIIPRLEASWGFSSMIEFENTPSFGGSFSNFLMSRELDRNDPDSMLSAIIENFQMNSSHEFKEGIVHRYGDIAHHKVACTDFGLRPISENSPNDYLSLDHLREIHSQLTASGAGADCGIHDPEGNPVYVLVVSQFAHRNLIHQGLQRGVTGSEMIFAKDGRMKDFITTACDKSYEGFCYVASINLPRFDKTGCSLPKYLQYLNAPRLNPAYMNSQFEEAYVFHPSAVSFQIHSPQNPLGGAVFVSTEGIHKKFGIKPSEEAKKSNGKYGRILADLSFESEPKKFEFGWAIRHSRCSRHG